ncbi:MAG: hypothetical protein Q9174_003192 [Haloplaca sp. 1 TL-2023]
MESRKRVDDGSSKELSSCDTDVNLLPRSTAEPPVSLSHGLEFKNSELQASQPQEPVPTHEDAPRDNKKKKRRRHDHVNGTTDTLPTGNDAKSSRHDAERTRDGAKTAEAYPTAIAIDSELVRSHEERKPRRLKKEKRGRENEASETVVPEVDTKIGFDQRVSRKKKRRKDKH